MICVNTHNRTYTRRTMGFWNLYVHNTIPTNEYVTDFRNPPFKAFTLQGIRHASGSGSLLKSIHCWNRYSLLKSMWHSGHCGNLCDIVGKYWNHCNVSAHYWNLHDAESMRHSGALLKYMCRSSESQLELLWCSRLQMSGMWPAWLVVLIMCFIWSLDSVTCWYWGVYPLALGARTSHEYETPSNLVRTIGKERTALSHWDISKNAGWCEVRGRVSTCGDDMTFLVLRIPWDRF